jgi:MurNAc alpha-1-phosphate uridylyltransferase
MTQARIHTAMILAAGRGTRMRAKPGDPPKPLVEVAGQSPLSRLLDRLEAAGIERIIVNLHHKAEWIKAHLAARENRAQIIFSDETDRLLDTGGGVKKALPWLGEEPFLVCNSDVLWLEAHDNISRLMAHFDAEKMDVLLLLADIASSTGYDGDGDYCRSANGTLQRRSGPSKAAIFSGVRVVTPHVVEAIADTEFSFNAVFDAAENCQRLHGLMLQGRWMHVGTPEHHAEAEALINASS